MYGYDLAQIHHLGFGDFSRNAAPGLLEMIRRAGKRGGRVVDLGCGSGLWLRQAELAGHPVYGIDVSPQLLEIARREVPDAALVGASIYDTEIPACDVVTALGEVLSYLPEAEAEPRSLDELFVRIARALSPGGLFIFDDVVEGPPLDYRSFRTGDSWAVLVEVAEDRERRRLVREITTFFEHCGYYQRAAERHVQVVRSRAEVETALRRAGFSVRAMRRYGDLELAPRRLAFRARRR